MNRNVRVGLVLAGFGLSLMSTPALNAQQLTEEEIEQLREPVIERPPSHQELAAEARMPENAIKRLSGKISGDAIASTYLKYDEQGRLAMAPIPIVFTDVRLSANFDSNTATLFATYVGSKNGEDVEIEFKGKINDEGIIFMRPTQSGIKGIAGLQCDPGCERLLIEIGVDFGLGFQQQQFEMELAK